MSAGTDTSSPSQLRADSCWSDAVGAEEKHQSSSIKENESTGALRNFYRVRGGTAQLQFNANVNSCKKNSQTSVVYLICFCCFTVTTCCHSSLIFSYLACFQAIKLKCPGGEQTGSSHTSPGMNRAVSMTTSDLVTPTALVRKYEFSMVTLFCKRFHFLSMIVYHSRLTVH